ncbi:MAG TPA: replicative DNA helicase [Vicinamibacterales bacterium]|nr:replicative DNA helicase [Vicinamibacterales bacterium]
MPESVAAPERTLPHNLEAERSVLGAILIHNDAINAAAQLIDSHDFFRDAHRRIWDKMVALSEKSLPIDYVTLKEELSRSGELDEVGGPAYITALVDGVPRSTNVDQYARIVKEKALLRSLIHFGNRIASSAYVGEDDPETLVDNAERLIFDIAERGIHGGFVAVRDLVHDSFARIELLQQRKGFVTGVPSGFHDLDQLTAGFQNSDFVIVAARPSMGKTSLVLNIAQHVGYEGHTVGFFSLEMSKEQLFLRLLSAEAGIESSKFRGGYLSERDYGRLGAAMGKLSECRIFVDDTASIGVLEMRAKCRRLKKEHGLDLVIVDYIQLMAGRGRFENRQQEIASISRSIKGLAKELNVPIIALSQLSRAPESRGGDHRPQLSDLRESGALEQDADLVLFIYRPEVYDKEGARPEEQGVAEIIIGKQRNGPIGTVKLTFIHQYTKFENYASPQ